MSIVCLVRPARFHCDWCCPPSMGEDCRMLEIGFPERSPSTSPWCVAGHPAGLNFGDCFAYALASVTGGPLLSKGEDFGHPDVRVA